MRNESADSAGVQVSRIVGLNRREQRPGLTPRGGHPIPPATLRQPPPSEQPTTRQHLACASTGSATLLEREGAGRWHAAGPAPSSARGRAGLPPSEGLLPDPVVAAGSKQGGGAWVAGGLACSPRAAGDAGGYLGGPRARGGGRRGRGCACATCHRLPGRGLGPQV